MSKFHEQLGFKVWSLFTDRNNMNGWGTVLDDIDKVPKEYTDFSFDEINHDDLEDFLRADDMKKVEMAYWAEWQTGRKAFKYGAITTLTVVLLLFLVLFVIFFRKSEISTIFQPITVCKVNKSKHLSSCYEPVPIAKSCIPVA